MKAMLTLAPLALAVVAAGCGGGGSDHPPAAHSSSRTVTSSFAMVGTRHTKIGTVLVDGRGRTLYLFEKDRGTTSECHGACVSVWPPLKTSSKPGAGKGAIASKLGVSGKIATYAGHPLYTYAGDGKPGDVHGQGANQFGAEWYALSPSGRKIDDD